MATATGPDTALIDLIPTDLARARKEVERVLKSLATGFPAPFPEEALLGSVLAFAEDVTFSILEPAINPPSVAQIESFVRTQLNDALGPYAEQLSSLVEPNCSKRVSARLKHWFEMIDPHSRDYRSTSRRLECQWRRSYEFDPEAEPTITFDKAVGLAEREFRRERDAWKETNTLYPPMLSVEVSGHRIETGISYQGIVGRLALLMKRFHHCSLSAYANLLLDRQQYGSAAIKQFDDHARELLNNSLEFKWRYSLRMLDYPLEEYADGLWEGYQPEAVAKVREGFECIVWDVIEDAPQPERQEEDERSASNIDTNQGLATSRLAMLAEYVEATDASEYYVMTTAPRLKLHTCHKPQFGKWKRGILPANSATTLSLERFLKAKAPVQKRTKRTVE